MAKQNQRDEELQSLSSAVVGLQEAIKSVNASIKETAKEAAVITQDAADVFTEQSKAAESLAGKLQGYSQEQLKLKGESAKLDKDLVKASNERVKLQGKIAFFEQKLATATGKEADILNKLIGQYSNKVKLLDESVEHADELKQILEDIDRDVKLFDDIAEVVGDVPVLSKVFKDFGKAAKAAREAGGGRKGFVAGMKEYTSALAKAAAIFTGGVFIGGFKKVNEQTTQLSRNLNISRDQALKLRNSFESSRFSIAQLLEGQTAVNESLGSAGTINNESARQMAIMTNRLGLSADESATLFNLSAATGKSLKENTDFLTGQVMALNESENSAVDYKKVMQDVAGASAAVTLSTEKFPGGIAKAAFNARKFGLTLSQVDNIAEGLLNFEESIGAELEAELLIGKELNLERARMFALTNDMAGLQQELANQGITAEKFAGMNRIAQEATAKAMGMSRDEMAEMLVKQEALKKVAEDTGIRGLANKNIEEQVAELMKVTNLETGKKYTRAEALGKLGEKEMARQEENMSMQEAMNNAMEQLTDTVGLLGDPLNTIAGIFKSIADFVQLILKTLTFITGLRFANIGKLGKMATNASSKVADVGSKLGIKGMQSTASATGGAISASASSPTGFRNAKGQFAKAPKSSGGGIMGRVGKWIGKNAMKVLKLPILSSIIEGIFAKGDIERMISTATDKNTLLQSIGKRSVQAVGSVGGGALGAALGSMIPIPFVGTALGYMAGDALGRFVAGKLADFVGAKPIGEFVLNNLFPNAKAEANKMNPELGLATGGIITQPTRALVGEAGAEAVVPLNQMYAKFDEMIKAIKESRGDVLIDGNKAGQFINLAANQSRN